MEKPKQPAPNAPFRVYLGHTKKSLAGVVESVYLEGFKWDCDWYWAGGYIGNKNFHAHFDDAFLETPDIRGHILGRFITPWSEKPANCPYYVVSNGCSIWENITTFLDDVPEHISKNWWRIKDLYKQFYALQKAAEVFQYDDHCTDQGRTEAEIVPDMAAKINLHIGTVIIPEIVKIVTAPKPEEV